MKRKKLLALGCVAVMLVSCMSGCQGKSESSEVVEEESIASTEDSVQAEGDAMTVKVTAVEGDTITAEVGTLTIAEMGEMPESGAPSGEAPSGETPSGEAPSGEAPSGEAITFTLTDNTVITLEYLQGSGEGSAEDVVLGAVLEVTLDAEGNATAITVKNLNAGNGFGGSSEVTNGTAANTIDEDTEEEAECYASSGDDENALRVDGATVTLKDVIVEKSGGASSNTENGDFYGQNAGLLALNGAQVTIQNATVHTNAVNGNGVFSYGEGTVVTISDSTIRTTMNNSGGI